MFAEYESVFVPLSLSLSLFRVCVVINHERVLGKEATDGRESCPFRFPLEILLKAKESRTLRER